MSQRRSAPTKEHRPPTEEVEPPGRPALLSAFPMSGSPPIPASNAVVGREWLADAGLRDDEVSQEHLRFLRARGRIEIEDVGSTNGTFVDGHRLSRNQRVPLDDGSLIRLGRTLLVYREAFAGAEQPDADLGDLVGPWGLREIRAEIGRLAGQRVWNILLLGESGTGKELLAREVARTLRRNERYGELNLAAVPEDRLEAELFGWEQGAFTGSLKKHPGLIGACAGGAVFLDELGELPLALQPKLLRLLDNHQVQPLGALRAELVDVVVIAATNRALDDEVKAGRFRLDLRERFGICLALPRLADRPEDLFAIFKHLYRRAHGDLDLSHVRVDVEAIELLMLHDWPGNVRALDRVAQAVDPRVGLKLSVARRVLDAEEPAKTPALTREVVAAALVSHENNQSQAARALGVSRPRLLRAMKKHGLGRGASD